MAKGRSERCNAGEPDDERAGIVRLRQALHVYAGAERRHRRRYHGDQTLLPLGHLRALFLLMAEHEATAGRLAKEAELSLSSASAMVVQLEARGLVQRRRDAVDRRVSWVSLTDAGRVQVREMEVRWSRLLGKIFREMPDADLEAAARVLDQLTLLFVDFSEPHDDAR